MKYARLVGFALSFAHAIPTLAQEDDGLCRNGMFAEQNASFGLARINGVGRSQFYQDMDGCPARTARCLARTYLLPGDRIVTGRTRGEFVCAYFPNSVGGTAGWMRRNRLAALPVNRAPLLSRWLGAWADGDNEVRFSMSRSRLSVDGDAYWPSANPSPEERPGGPNVGQIGGPVSVEGNQAFEPECQVTFHLLGDILIVADPARQCGGMNVMFTGVYLRKSAEGALTSPPLAHDAGSPRR